MFKFCVVLAFCIAVCYAAPGAGGTYCAQTPEVTTFNELLEVIQNDIQYSDTNLRVPVSPEDRDCYNFEIFQCLNSPHVINTEVAAKCVGAKYISECDRLTCIFRESKWLDGAAVEKTKVAAYFDQFEKDHAEWGPAIQNLKTACLGPELKAQGVFLNCPAYDVMHCVLASFIKHATPSQWSTSTSCTYPRAYAAACPVCPSDCYSAQVPIGSCNACFLPPKTT